MTTVNLPLLADLLIEHLRPHCADPSPVRDATETELIDQCFTAGIADLYLAGRMNRAIRRLHPGRVLGEEAWATGDAVNDALIVLGAYARLRDLQSGVAA
jgi:hypothetical protein